VVVYSAEDAQRTRRYGNCNQPFSAAVNLRTSFDVNSPTWGFVLSRLFDGVRLGVYQRGSRGCRTESL
jgi:hypothetical protein